MARLRRAFHPELALAVFVLLAGCFESGPLDFGGLGADTGVATDTAADTSDAVEDSAPADSAEADTTPDSDGEDSAPDTADTSEASDTGDTGDAIDGVADTSDVTSCTGDEECADVPVTDLCAGPIRCIEESCRPDPAGAVTCTSDSSCVVSRCNPDTGACEDEDICSCETPQLMLCGIAKSWFTNILDAIPSYQSYGCGPPNAASMMRLISLPVTGRVRISANDGVAGMHVLAGDVCDPVEACLVGGVSTLYFDAQQSERYTLAVEEIGPNQQVSVRADCDVKTETFCKDELDDDGDSLTDCDDRDCDRVAGCEAAPLEETGLCGDSLDNDVDSATDCDDDDCVADPGCLELCEVPTWSTYCNYSQGLDNGAGRARATNYACNPEPQTAKEIVFPVLAEFSGRVRIGFSGSDGLTLHLLVDTGRGCTPKDCLAKSTGDMFIDLIEGTTYYLVVDGPGDVVGNFFIAIDCEL